MNSFHLICKMLFVSRIENRSIKGKGKTENCFYHYANSSEQIVF